MIQKCRFFPVCGGCSYLNLSEDEYREKKSKNLKETLENLEIASLDFFWILEKSRRKITLQVDNNNKIGFFAKGSKTLVEIDECYVSEDDISKTIPLIRNLLKTFENNLFSQISITLFDNIIDVIFFVRRELNFTQIQNLTEFARANKINISYQVKKELFPIYILQNNQILLKNYSSESDLKIDLNSEIFIQATKKGLQKIIEIISNFIKNNFDKKPQVVDIYAGFGIYSFAISHLAKEVLAFEGSEEMTKLIIKNAAKNSLANKVIAKNRDLFFYPISYKELEHCDLAIINPPRNGATPQVKEIANSNVKNFIYVSCNPKTFVFDAKILLEKGFKIEKIIAIDQFYSSDHFELVAIFKKG